ncbi:hypothetical protein [Streptomyces sp. N35]|uniref:hypothetical protein n=1 Tax=Streptomyces sp. N35 TaxID=2795730 RepID=UPI0018F4C9B6|nr:hypothetical protein [Streptomyces sp. N35]
MIEFLGDCVTAVIITAEVTSSFFYLIRWISRSTFAAALVMIRSLASERYGWAMLSAATAVVMASVWWDEHPERVRPAVGKSTGT